MRVLITNDDGINSLGLLSLYNFTKHILCFDDVWIVAPDVDKSASSHSVSLSKSIVVKRIDDKKFSVSGSPVDCVVIAVTELMKDNPPDVVFSGINSGANIGKDILYSGTVGAAMEGTFLGIPSFAFSKLYNLNKQSIVWEIDNEKLKKLVLDLLSEKDVLLNNTININLPVVKNVKGVKFVKQSIYKTTNLVSTLDHDFIIYTESKALYCAALMNNFITVTTLGYDITDHINLKYLDGKYTY